MTLAKQGREYSSWKKVGAGDAGEVGTAVGVHRTGEILMVEQYLLHAVLEPGTKFPRDEPAKISYPPEHQGSTHRLRVDSAFDRAC